MKTDTCHLVCFFSQHFIYIFYAYYSADETCETSWGCFVLFCFQHNEIDFSWRFSFHTCNMSLLMQSKVNILIERFTAMYELYQDRRIFVVLKEPDVYSVSIFLCSWIVVLNNVHDKTMKPTRNNHAEIHASLVGNLSPYIFILPSKWNQSYLINFFLKKKNIFPSDIQIIVEINLDLILEKNGM